MRLLLGIFAVWMLIALPAASQEAAPGAAIQGVISDQIAAFEADDFDRAFGHASPEIQRLFRTPENFGAMVQRGYPMVYRPAEVRFLDLGEVDGAPVQNVLIRDAAGNSHILAYRMQPGPEGWVIAGVAVLKSPGVAA